MNESFICKICDNNTDFRDNYVYCKDCNIYWGESADAIANTFERIQLKNLFIEKPLYDDSQSQKKQDIYLNRILIEVFVLAVLWAFM